jgi:hypothetical protein
MGLGPAWASLSEATRDAICELPPAALRELADLTSATDRRRDCIASSSEAPSQ